MDIQQADYDHEVTSEVYGTRKTELGLTGRRGSSSTSTVTL